MTTEGTRMQMAKADDADMLALLDVVGVVEQVEKGYLPANDNVEDDSELWFDRDNLEHCQQVIDKLIEASGRGGLMRAAFGLTVLLHPKNELVDPDSDVIKKHPKILSALAAQEANEEVADRYRFLLQLLLDKGVLNQDGNGAWALRGFHVSTEGQCGSGTTPEQAIDNAIAGEKSGRAGTSVVCDADSSDISGGGPIVKV